MKSCTSPVYWGARNYISDQRPDTQYSLAMWLPLGRRYRYSPLTNSASLFHRATFSPALSALFVFFVLYILSALFLWQSSWRDPTSWFFNPDTAYEPIYTITRRQQAHKYIENVSKHKEDNLVKFNPSAGDDTLCVGIVTFARSDVRYLRSTIGSLLQGLEPRERKRIFLVPFIAHTDPFVHPAYSESWLHEVADQVLTYNVSREQFDHISRLEHEGGLFREKALLDYTYLLKACSSVGTPHMAIFEDDIIAMDGWFHRTEDAIVEVEAQTAIQHHAADCKIHERSITDHILTLGSSVLYLRLFYTEKFLGWNSEEWPTYLRVSLFALAFLASMILGIRSYYSSTRGFLTNSVVAVLCGICLPLAIILFFAAGKATSMPFPSGVHEMNSFGCCSQGLVFSHGMAQNLIQWYEEKKVGFVDMLTEEYGDLTGYTRWALTPSVIQHIGRKSSKEDDYGPNSKHGRSVAETIWNFGFELNDAVALREEHDQVTQKWAGT
jgi:N-Acetylglucosaminyltransferase-IV (GnT-IV) conserved region